MNTEELTQAFQDANDKPYGELSFSLVENKLSQRADLHAFLRLDALIPGNDDIVSASEHDEFWLCFDEDAVAAVATPELVLELVRCGVMYEEGMGFSIFA